MKCLMIDEYRAIENNILDKLKDKIVYQSYHPNATMVGPIGHHPNRCIYMIPESDPYYSLWSIKGIGWQAEFSDEIARNKGWI